MRTLPCCLLAASLLLFGMAPVGVQAKDYLRTCWQKQVEPLQAQYLVLNYQETVNELEHSFAPWQSTAYTGRGTVWSKGDTFLKRDTLYQAARQRTSYSITQRTATTLLFQDYGAKALSPATRGMQQDHVFRAARYSPVALLAYFRDHRIPADAQSPAEFACYQTTINETVVRLFIRKKDALLTQVVLLSPDKLFGDVTTSFTYRDYTHRAKLYYPATVQVAKVNGKLQDEVRIRAVQLQPDAPVLLTAPVGYQLQSESAAQPQVRVQTYRPHIYFLELPHTDDRVMVVEFDRFLLVAEAPVSSENGELIIREAQKLAPGKPIRYFAAGHYHPHYLGGMRPFVARGATVLHGTGMGPYVRYLAAAPHTLRPDSLQRAPKPLQAEEIQAMKTISDGRMELQIFCLGAPSAHTQDYLLYYFPGEKLLFQDDSVWIPKQGAVGKANPRQAAIYQAIKSLKLDVETITQSWPVADYGVKTIIPFADLEQSMK